MSRSSGITAPASSDWECWRNGCSLTFSNVAYQTAGMQQLLDAVRATGARQPVMVGGLDWADDPCGLYDAGGYDGVCNWLAYQPTDPDGQVILSFHNYEGMHCDTTGCWDQSVLPVAKAVPVVTGELGEPDCSASYIDSYMDWADRYGISYLAWSWQPPIPSSDACAATNEDLLSNWDGQPSTTAPATRRLPLT